MGWRTSDGRYYTGSYESWVDRQIREAQERGEFDDLPGSGKPLRHLGRPDDPEWWVKQLVTRENLDVSAVLPPQLALRRELQDLPDRVLKQPTEQAVRDLAEDFNVRVRECWRRPLEGPAVPVRTVDADELVAHWQAHGPPRSRAHPDVGPAQPEPKHAKGWLSRTLGRLRPSRARQDQ